MITEISIDSSSLNRAFDSDDKWQKLLGVVKNRDCRIIISPAVFTEVIAGDDLTSARTRANKLALLWDTAGPKFSVSKDVRQIIEEELRSPISQTPLHDAEDCQLIRTKLTAETSPFFSGLTRHEINQEMLDAKQASKAVDRDLLQKVEKKKVLADKKTRDNELAYMKSYNGVADSSEFILIGLFDDPQFLSDRGLTIADIRLNEHYRAARLFLSHAHLQMFGVVLAGYSTDPVVNAFKKDKGNWIDASIMACAAYSKEFIIDDPRANIRGKFLVERGIAKFTVITLDEWLQA